MAKTIYEVLSKEHAEAKELLDQLASSSANDTRMRRVKGAQVAIELISHNEAESQALYQRLMDFEEMRDHVEEHQDEHEEANKELSSFLDMDVKDAGWLEKLKEIKQAIEHHIEDEEGKLFPEAQKHLDKAEAEELAERFDEEKFLRKELLKAA